MQENCKISSNKEGPHSSSGVVIKGVSKATGPISEAGKRIVSKNAQKSAMFTKGYLESENPALRQKQFEILCEQWGAQDFTRQSILRTFEAAQLGYERMGIAICQKIEGKMQSVDIALEFVKQVGLTEKIASTIPSWYFAAEDAGDEKSQSFQINRICEQANLVYCELGDRQVSDIDTKYPELFNYVMAGQGKEMQFFNVLARRHQKGTPALNMDAFLQSFETHYFHHLNWAKHHQRYAIIIEGIRADERLKAMELDKYHRYATGFQNHMIKSLQALGAVNQLEASRPQAMVVNSSHTTENEHKDDGQTDSLAWGEDAWSYE